jgi:hypothetical protein
MNKPKSRLGFVGKMAAGAPASAVGEEEESLDEAGGKPAELPEPVNSLPSSPVPREPTPLDDVAIQRSRSASAPTEVTQRIEPAPSYGYLSSSGPRPRRTNYVRIHVTMDADLANFVDIRWRTYRLSNGRLAASASAYIEDLIARDRAAHPVES